MANNFSAVRVKQMAASVVGQLKANHVFGNVVTKGRDLNAEFFSGDRFANKGDTMVVELQPTLVATEHNPSGNTAQDVTPPTAELKLDTILTVDLDISSLDLSTMNEKTILSYGRSAAEALDKKIDQKIRDVAMLTPNYLTQVFASGDLTKKSVLGLIKKANDLLIPNTDRAVVLDTATQLEILNLDNFLSADKRADGGAAFREAIIGRALGATWLMDQNCATEATPADTALAVNEAAGYAAGSTVIAFDGGSSSDLQAGDMVSFADETGTPYHTVAAVTFAVAGTSGTLTLADGLVSATADDAVITVKRPGQSVLIHRSGIAFGLRPLRPFNDGISQTVVTPDGYSIRSYFEKVGDKKTEKMTFDLLMGIKMIDSNRVVRYPRIA